MTWKEGQQIEYHWIDPFEDEWLLAKIVGKKNTDPEYFSDYRYTVEILEDGSRVDAVEGVVVSTTVEEEFRLAIKDNMNEYMKAEP